MPIWIADSDFERAVTRLQSRAKKSFDNAETRRVRNVVDPFLTLVIASTFDISDLDELGSAQRLASAIQGTSNAMGEFHQGILGSVPGWVDHDAGYDLECEDRNIIVQIKNKWNTMNADNKRIVVDDLEVALRQKSGDWTAYVVQVIPRKPERYQKELERNIIETDGATFYHIATGYPNAIHELFEEICDRLSPTNEIAQHCQKVMSDSLPPRQYGDRLIAE